MGLMNLLRARRDLSAGRGALLPAGPEDLSGATVLWSSYGRMDVEQVLPTLTSFATHGYAGSSPVFSLIALRMLLFSEAVPRWYDRDRRRMTDDTDGLEILLNPWPGADAGEMLARAELDVSLAGNAFIAHPEGLDRLVRLRPDWTTIQRIVRRDGRGRPYTEVDGYWHGNPATPDEFVFYDVSEVAHYCPYPDPLADFRGMSWLTPVVREITQDRVMSDYTVRFFENAAPQPLDARVLTPAGWSTMGEMRVGSEVIGSDGKPHTVVAVYPQGERDIYRVTFSDGAVVESTDDHVWTVQSYYDVRRRVARNMTLRRIMDGGTHYRSGPAKWSVPFVEPVQFDGPDTPLPLDPYLLGSLLGDGCFGTASFPSQQYRNPLLAIIKDLGLFGVTGADKFVPDVYLTASIPDRVALLQGLMDTDGSVGATAVRFTNNSRALADAVVDLVGSLGGTASIGHQRVRSDKTTYEVTIKRLPEGIVPFRLARKAAAYRPLVRGGRRRFIVSIEYARRAQAQCIAVDVDDHLYVTDDYVLTHNSPNMIVKYQQNLGPERLRQVQDNLRQRHAGLDNSYQAIVLDSGADITVAGNSFEQMNFTSLRSATENRLASASGVPPMIVGFKEGLQAATLANYDAASRRLADMTMRPLWRSFANVMRRVVVPPRKVGQVRDRIVLRFDSGDIAALQEGAQARADTFKTKALTAGELIRAGYEPKTVADAVEAEALAMLTHTEKTPTALYDAEGNQANAKPEENPAPGPRPGKQGEGAAAPQPRAMTGDDDMHPDDVRRLLAEQRDSMLEAFRAGMEAGRLSVVVDDDDQSVRHPGHPDQKVHGRRQGGGSGDSPDDPIKTGDPSVAARALYENKYVEFRQPRAVSTSLLKLKQMIDEAQARGEDKGQLNLCRATLAGSNLFCVEHKGIPRTKMPQLSGRPLPGTKADKMPKNAKGEVDLGPAFREHLKSKGIGIKDGEVDASMLRATQSELQTSKVLGIAQAMREGKVGDARIFTTQDDYIVDGHHRWAAKVSNEFVTGKKLTQPVATIQSDILTVLAYANEFALDMGIPQAGIGVPGRSAFGDDVGTFSAVQQRVAAEFGAAMLDWLHGA